MVIIQTVQFCIEFLGDVHVHGIIQILCLGPKEYVILAFNLAKQTSSRHCDNARGTVDCRIIGWNQTPASTFAHKSSYPNLNASKNGSKCPIRIECSAFQPL
ncbi:hypothetical protein AVEN_24575-1 [Araneus ventricosus]|uniref:Uncharacterized protein n=1 Tax=Araneus ventricosus TaxID=182803 RepID=A0A4Y2FCS6_ARAVE|nr:hypothetical protein AVEN_24575-1 [Araneus ventricosus]